MENVSVALEMPRSVFHDLVYNKSIYLTLIRQCSETHICFVYFQDSGELVAVKKFKDGEGLYMSRVMRKPDFCLCENKGADQLCSNCTADQRLCFCYNSDSTIPLLSKSKISSLYPSSVLVQASLCWSGLEYSKTAFLAL